MLQVRLEFDLAPDDPHAAAKRGLLQGCQSNRGYRVSMHHDGPDATIEAYSYLRFIHARVRRRNASPGGDTRSVLLTRRGRAGARAVALAARGRRRGLGKAAHQSG